MAKVFLCALCSTYTTATAGLHGGRKKNKRVSVSFQFPSTTIIMNFNYYQHAEQKRKKKCRVLLLRETEQMTKNKALIIIFPPSLTTQLICRPWRTPPPVAARRFCRSQQSQRHNDRNVLKQLQLFSKNIDMKCSCLIFELKF